MKHSKTPWRIVSDNGNLTIRNDNYIIAGEIESLHDANLILQAPEMLRILKNIIRSAPLTGIPLALEKDIQDACLVVSDAQRKVYYFEV